MAAPSPTARLYPAIKRLAEAGLLTRQARPGQVAAPRQVLTLTPAGYAELVHRLAAVDVADDPSWLAAGREAELAWLRARVA